MRTADSRHAFPVAPDLLGRKFVADGPNQVWPADLTYIPTGEGWLHLAAIMDLHTRKVVRWASATTCGRNSPPPRCSWPSSAGGPHQG